MKTFSLSSLQRLALAALAAGVLTIHAPHARAALAVTDQADTIHDTEYGVTGSSSIQVNPFGQSFTPTLAAMNAATFYLTATGTATVTVNVYMGTGFGGTLLGTSGPVSFSNTGFANIEFDLPSVLTLIPGNVYTLKLTDAANSTFYGFTSGFNAYTRGSLYFNGIPSDTYDISFAEGVTSANLLVPEPSTWALMAVGSAGLGGMALRRRARRA